MKCKIVGFLHSNRECSKFKKYRFVRCRKKDRILYKDGTAEYIGDRQYIKSIIGGIIWKKN